MISRKTPTRQLVNDLREIQRLDRDIQRRQQSARITARFEAMHGAQARQARRQMHAAIGLGLAALITFLAIFHDVTARTAATVLEAEAQGAW